MLQDNYRTMNKFLIVTVQDKRALKNGLSVTETRGKRDIVKGIVEVAEANLKLPQRCQCWFPLFAGTHIRIEDKDYLAVPFDDIIMIENCSE